MNIIGLYISFGYLSIISIYLQEPFPVQTPLPGTTPTPLPGIFLMKSQCFLIFN